MVRMPGVAQSTVLRAKLSRGPRWRGAATASVACLLVVLGAVAVFSSRASSYPDTILSVTDLDGGFMNGIQAIDSKTGVSLGAVALNVPALSGCSVSRPKAYIGDMTVDQPHNVLYVNLKPCAGGTLPQAQAMIVMDLKSVAIKGFLPGPADAHVVASQQADTIYAIRADGMEMSVVNVQTGTVVKTHLLSTPISRSGADSKSGDMIAILSSGSVERFSPNGGRTAIVQSNLAFPLTPQAQDNNRLIAVGDTWYAAGKQGTQWGLAKVTATGTSFTAIQSEAVSIEPTKGNEFIFIQTACATGINCAANPNRMYSYNLTTNSFQSVSQDPSFPLQQPGDQVRFNFAGDRLFFDGVVAGASGVGQRFVFPVDTDGAMPTGARIAIPGSEWVLANLNDDSKLEDTPPITVDLTVPGGGGVGLNSGSISPTGISIDELERLLGMSIKDTNFDLVSDAQIRAYGYDPAMVRKNVAQYKLGLASGGSSNAAASRSLCSGSSAGAGVDLTAIERKIGVPLSQIDFSQVSDDQIRQFGYDPKIVRDYIAQSKSDKSAIDSCANVFTQDGFVSNAAVDPATLAAGSAANVTAQTSLDLLKGGWVMTLRWQAPGGAEKFRIYGRDNNKHKLEQQLAVVDSLSREATFGGFSQLALPPISDETYWFSVVPVLGDAKLGTPAAVKTRVRCLLWCVAEKAK